MFGSSRDRHDLFFRLLNRYSFSWRCTHTQPIVLIETRHKIFRLVEQENHSLMKKALWSMLEFFVGHNRREKTNPVHREYCICGAPKPEKARRRKRELSFKTESRLHRI